MSDLAPDLENLSVMSIEQLMNIKVSILGASETVSKTPAAVAVVTQEDIHRSGAMNFPEALRLVPGMIVAQADASQWAVSSRGFNDIFANKLLVLQDGRSIYTPLFSGVFWDVQGTMLEDISHIEVVRGPGATLWGANAVNGVINILTKSAQDTQGGLVSGGGGMQERGFAGARFGGRVGEDAYYRVYGTYLNRDETVLPDGSGANNSWQLGRIGFRTDWNVSPQDLITFQGDGYAGAMRQIFGVFNPTNPPTFTDSVKDDLSVSGGNVLGRWTHTFSDTSRFKVQSYYDHTEREAVILDEARDSFDLTLQHEFRLGERHAFVWGAGYRLISDSQKNNNPSLSFNPASDTLNLFSGFVQHELAVVKDRLFLTIGSKLEHNDYTDWEVQPGVRLLWTPYMNHSFWASVSRAVRTPSRAEENVTLTQSTEVAPGFFVPVTIRGNPAFRAEELLAYELGYRSQPGENVSFDLALFFNDYDHLRSQSPLSPTEFYVSQNVDGHTYGVEITATWRVTDWWRLQPAYTFLQMNLDARPDSSGFADNRSVTQAEGSSPENQFSIRSSMDLGRAVTFDTALRYVDRLPTYRIDSYVELSARLGWRINKNLEASIVGQNLLHDQHAEFGPSYIKTQNGNITEIPRSVFGKITWRF